MDENQDHKYSGNFGPIDLLSAADNLFESSSSSDIRSIACLNYLPDEWWLRIIGFKDSADMLVDQMIMNNTGQQDALVYPILFLYRHYLEIAIKSLIIQARKVGKIQEPLEKTHKLDKLWMACSDQIKKNHSSGCGNEHPHITRLMKEFCSLDPYSEAFRYPTTKSGYPTLPGLFNIDIQHVKAVINKISDVLKLESMAMDDLLDVEEM